MTDLGDMVAVQRSTIDVRRAGVDAFITAGAVEWHLRAYSTGCWGIWGVRAGGKPLIEEGSTMEYAFQIGRTVDPYQSGTTYDFTGGGHGSEALVSASFMLDGKPFNLDATGAELVVSQVIHTLMPKGSMAGLVVGVTHLRHRFTALGVQVEHSHAVTTPGLSYRTAYAAMLPGHRHAIDSAQCDGGEVFRLKRDGSIPVTGLRGRTYRLWHSDKAVNPYTLSMSLESPEATAGWTLAAPPGAWLYDRPDYCKWYVNWIGDDKRPAGPSIHRQTYTVRG